VNVIVSVPTPEFDQYFLKSPSFAVGWSRSITADRFQLQAKRLLFQLWGKTHG
jgi:hypothetical protein